MSNYIYVNTNAYNTTVQKSKDTHQAVVSARIKLADAQRYADEQEELLQMEMQDSINKMNAIKDKLDAEADNIAEKMAELEEQICLELGKTKLWYKAELSKLNGEICYLSDNVANLDEKFNEFVRVVSGRMAELDGEITQKRLQAELCLKELNELQERLMELHIDKFQPLLKEEYGNIIKDVETDITSGSYETAIGLAQVYIAKENTTVKELETLNKEYKVAKEEALKLEKELVAEFETLQTRTNQKVICEKPKRVVFDGDLDYWSEGEFGKMSTEFEVIQESLLESYVPDMKIQQIKEAISKMKALKEALAKCVESAEAEFTEYFFVDDMAETIKQILQGTPWNVKQSAFSDDDKRKAYNIYAQNGSGTSIVIVIMQQRELLSRDRKGKKKYGKTQFRVTVEDNNESDYDGDKCQRILDGVISTISEVEDIGSDNLKGNRQISKDDTDTFVTRVNEESNKAKYTRIAEMIN